MLIDLDILFMVLLTQTAPEEIFKVLFRKRTQLLLKELTKHANWYQFCQFVWIHSFMDFWYDLISNTSLHGIFVEYEFSSWIHRYFQNMDSVSALQSTKMQGEEQCILLHDEVRELAYIITPRDLGLLFPKMVLSTVEKCYPKEWYHFICVWHQRGYS